MKVIEMLATSLGIRDEKPNQALAKIIIDTNNNNAVAELVQILKNSNKNLQHDAIKTLYEIGETSPKLIAIYADEFIELLNSKNNRMQWGAMTAVCCIAYDAHDKVYKSLDKVLDVAAKGTVITKDRCVRTLIALCKHKEYLNTMLPLLIEQILSAPANQFVTYAEQTLEYLNQENKFNFIHTLNARKDDINTDAKQKRFDKILKKVAVIV